MQRQLPARLMKSMSVSSLPPTSNLQELACAHPKGLVVSLWLWWCLFLCFCFSHVQFTSGGFFFMEEHMAFLCFHVNFSTFWLLGSVSNWMVKGATKFEQVVFLQCMRLSPRYLVIIDK